MPIDDWLNPRPQLKSDEELRRELDWAPEHIKPHILEQLGMDPETRKLDLTVRQTETDMKRAVAAQALTSDLIKQREIEERIADKTVVAEEKRNERERIKRNLTPDAVGGPRQLLGRTLGAVQPRLIHWLWTGWVPKGYITLLAGETGAGKTTVLADIVARVTTGMPWPGEFSAQLGQNATRPQPVRAPARVLWLGSEDGIEEMTVPRLMACGANLDNVIEIQGAVQQGKRSTFSMQDDIEAVGEWLTFAHGQNNPFAMLVIDPVTSYLPGQKLRKVDLNDAGQLRTVLEPWLILAQKHRIAVVCVTHFAKDTARAMLHRVLGSAAFAQTCRSLIAVIEPPATEEYEPDQFEKAMLQVKVNLPEHPGGAWRFSTEKVEVCPDPETGLPIYATRPAWDELDPVLTPKTAVGPARGPKSKTELPFAIFVSGLFSSVPTNTWLPVDQVRYSAEREIGVGSSWWNKHSSEYLDKQNTDGTWKCRPKTQQ